MIVETSSPVYLFILFIFFWNYILPLSPPYFPLAIFPHVLSCPYMSSCHVSCPCLPLYDIFHVRTVRIRIVATQVSLPLNFNPSFMLFIIPILRDD